MHHELSKDGENHKLGDVENIPLNQHTLGFHTSNFCFSFETLYRINLERLFVCFCFGLIFVLRPTLSFIYEKATGNMGWNILHAFIVLGKGCLSWFLMTHIVAWFMSFFMSNSLQMLYHELSLIHVLMLNVTLLGLT